MEGQLHFPDYNRVATPAMCREADRKTIEDFGIDGFTLMEIAAREAAAIIHRETGSCRSGLYLCGKGNNAGDALAAGRTLSEEAGHKINIFMAEGKENLSPDTAHNLALIEKLIEHGSDIHFLEWVPANPDADFDYIVDGLLGTGISGEVRSPYKEIIDRVNRFTLPVFSMDLPSGLDAETGNFLGSAVKASHTITFGMNKTGFYLNKAESCTGTVHLGKLPFPGFAKQFDASLITPGLHDLLPTFKRKARHKYDEGVVHIIAGSEGLTGAAIMAAKSAWQKGAGAVILYTTRDNLPIYEKNLPQVIKVVVEGGHQNRFTPEHSGTIIDSINKRPGVLLAGPGMGTSAEAGEMLMTVLSSTTGQAVLDADALSNMEAIKQLPEKRRRQLLLTPHIGEAKNYLGMHFEDDFTRFREAAGFAQKTGCSILLKGNPSFLIDSDSQKFITAYDTTPFTRAGFGDVLAGTIAANIGITETLHLSVIDALLYGLKKYHQHKSDTAFGPEHML
jgi:ADP-dependent NAD(P)H-hydrate dehydratase / NAD(P)H-hydrate epimerase